MSTTGNPYVYNPDVFGDRLRAYLNKRNIARILRRRIYPSGKQEIKVTTALPSRRLAMMAARADRGYVARSRREGRLRMTWWIRTR